MFTFRPLFNTFLMSLTMLMNFNTYLGETGTNMGFQESPRRQYELRQEWSSYVSLLRYN